MSPVDTQGLLDDSTLHPDGKAGGEMLLKFSVNGNEVTTVIVENDQIALAAPSP